MNIYQFYYLFFNVIVDWMRQSQHANSWSFYKRCSEIHGNNFVQYKEESLPLFVLECFADAYIARLKHGAMHLIFLQCFVFRILFDCLYVKSLLFVFWELLPHLSKFSVYTSVPLPPIFLLSLYWESSISRKEISWLFFFSIVCVCEGENQLISILHCIPV